MNRASAKAQQTKIFGAELESLMQRPEEAGNSIPSLVQQLIGKRERMREKE